MVVSGWWRVAALGALWWQAPAASDERDAKYFQELPKGAESYLEDLPDYARQGIVEWKAAWKVLGGDDIEELGPGVIGAQASNVNNLINTTLESYTQRGWSCTQCHQNAFPQGVTLPLPPIEQEYAPLHIISLLLQNARGTATEGPGGVRTPPR